jgi:hypothetical protein
MSIGLILAPPLEKSPWLCLLTLVTLTPFAQLGLDGGDAVGLQLAGDLLSLAIDAVPAVGEDFFGALRF